MTAKVDLELEQQEGIERVQMMHACTVDLGNYLFVAWSCGGSVV